MWKIKNAKIKNATENLHQPVMFLPYKRVHSITRQLNPLSSQAEQGKVGTHIPKAKGLKCHGRGL